MIFKKLALILTLAFLLLGGQLKATHIIGGYISYRCLGNNNYEVTLRMYRDCLPGTIPFNSAINLNITNSNSSVSHTIPRGTIFPIPDTSCVIPIFPICVEYGEFIDTFLLPPHPLGYDLSVELCCRNGITQNIPNSSGTLMWWNTSIPANDIACNSSPTLTAVPPVYQCLNKPINFQLPVSEPDGDSLAYEICKIYKQGGAEITFIPPHTYNNPFPATPAFAINDTSGQLSGTPTQLGHYVLGLCVTEYRNGVPLSTMRLDYEFNVANCISIKSDILTQAEDSTLFCKGLNMNFTAQSSSALQYSWDFGDSTTLADTANTQNPSYHYSQPGTYQVRLISHAGGCRDTSVANFIVEPLPDLSMLTADTLCFGESFPFGLVNTASSNYSLNWDFGPDASISNSAAANPPPVFFNKPGNQIITVKAVNGNCIFTQSDTIFVRPQLTSDMITPAEDSTMLCGGLTIDFISESLNAESLKWDFGDPTTSADISTSDSVSYTYPSPGVYTVTLLTELANGKCRDSLQYTIEVFPTFSPQLTSSGSYCFSNQEVSIFANGNFPQGASFSWDFGPYHEDAYVNGQLVQRAMWTEPGEHIVHLKVKKGYCVETVTDTIIIEEYPIAVEAGDTQWTELNQPIELKGSNGFSHYWFADEPVEITNRWSQNTSAEVLGFSDTVTFYLRVTDAQGCEGLDSTLIILNRGENNDLPNVLTPNGDGYNDLFDLSSYGITNGSDCDLTVMNRWGAEVFNRGPYLNNWSGEDNQGNPLPDGTYYFIIACDYEVIATGPLSIVRGFGLGQ